VAVFIQLRRVVAADLAVFYEHEQDPEARWMVAFTGAMGRGPEEFVQHWQKILRNPGSEVRTIVVDGRVAGNVLKYELDGHPEVAYWVGREYWGQGVASYALATYLREFRVRPVHARAAKDNKGSVRVLEKNGFRIVGEGTGFAGARNADTEEYYFRLD
jgi:RimJ/RimL family protein N-acetyltransferase